MDWPTWSSFANLIHLNPIAGFTSKAEFVTVGEWEARFTFQSNESASQRVETQGFALFEQDCLGRTRVAVYYDYDSASSRYWSEPKMSGYVSWQNERPEFKIFFKTKHYGDDAFSTVADTPKRGLDDKQTTTRPPYGVT